MADDVMLEIISLCLSIDAKAAKIYHELAQITVGKELRAFWKTMAGEERGHVDFWGLTRVDVGAYKPFEIVVTAVFDIDDQKWSGIFPERSLLHPMVRRASWA
jgi:hypothetical protein